MEFTQNYHLPIFEKGDNPALLGDLNSAMQIIDDNMSGGGGRGSAEVPDFTGKVFRQVSSHTISEISDSNFTLDAIDDPFCFVITLQADNSSNDLGVAGVIFRVLDTALPSWDAYVIPNQNLLSVNDGSGTFYGVNSVMLPVMKNTHQLKFYYNLYANANTSPTLTVKQYKLVDQSEPL